MRSAHQILRIGGFPLALAGGGESALLERTKVFIFFDIWSEMLYN